MISNNCPVRKMGEKMKHHGTGFYRGGHYSMSNLHKCPNWTYSGLRLRAHRLIEKPPKIDKDFDTLVHFYMYFPPFKIDLRLRQTNILVPSSLFQAELTVPSKMFKNEGSVVFFKKTHKLPENILGGLKFLAMVFCVFLGLFESRKNHFAFGLAFKAQKITWNM